jgi:hypothetical protein
MLATDYQRRLGTLINDVPNEIRLPEGFEDFFDEKGPGPFCESDRRRGGRTRARTQGILIPRKWLPVFPRSVTPKLIYTKDFSKTGFGFLAHQQYYPGERIRALLATFWMEILIQRCRRLGPNCYESGGTLLEQHDGSLEAFLDADGEVKELESENEQMQQREPDLSSP